MPWRDALLLGIMIVAGLGAVYLFAVAVALRERDDD